MTDDSTPTRGSAPVAVTEYENEAEDELATAAFQAAIDDRADRGGGTVVVPAGEYELGTIDLRSNVTLSLEAGATVFAAREKEAYDGAYGPDGERPFVRARGVENVAIVGRGTFDGRGTWFHEMDEPLRQHSGESDGHPLVSNAPHEARQGEDYLDPARGTEEWPRAKSAFRPGPMFFFEDARNVLLRDVTLRDMPGWTISLHDCVEATVRGVDVDNHMRIPNCDGISIMNSRNVRVSDCSIRSCDDSITIGTRSESDEPTVGIAVTNCTLSSAACAIKFGSETHGPIRDCVFDNCVVEASNRGLGIQHRDGGDLENVLFSNIVLETGLLPGPWWGKAEPIYVTSVPRDEATELGRVRNVRFSNVVARSENGALVYAHEDADVRDVRLEGVRLRVGGSRYADRVGGNLDLQPTAAMAPILERDIAGLTCENVRGLEVDDVAVEWDVDEGGEGASGTETETGGLPAYYTSALECVGCEELRIDGFAGRQAHLDPGPETESESGSDSVAKSESDSRSDAAITLRETETVSIRNSRALSGTGTFLSLEGTSDERLFANNDLADAATAVDGDYDFLVSGNVPPA